jgi:hypothetical protein
MTRNLFIATSLLLSLTYAISTSAEVYKTVDKNGRITYTDQPPANTSAKPVELKSINSIPAPTQVPDYSQADTGNLQEPQEYQVQILAPENGRTLLADERSVKVDISSNTSLENGDLYAYKIDGAILQTTKELSYVIVEPPRGEHILTVDVVGSNGQSLAQSNAITLIVMRPIVKPKATPLPTKK